MMKIYIPDITPPTDAERKALFILTRPFFTQNGWQNSEELRARWKVSTDYQYTSAPEEAEVLFIPQPVNTYSSKELAALNALCQKHRLRGFGYISGDFGEDFGHYKNLLFFRMGGFKSQLSENNKGFPVIIPDQLEVIYNKQEIEVRQKQELPVVGFCGHSDVATLKKLKENLKNLSENVRRFFRNPFRKDYEPFFPSAYERAKLLQSFEKSNRIKTNFIYRKHYRAGAKSAEERHTTTREYFENIQHSDYVLCVRGAGNFSVRLYETLMMGRIPIFVNTDCLLPFEDTLDWKQHVVWISWKDRKNIADQVADFHQNISPKDFENLQISNRNLWKSGLSVGQMLQYIRGGI